MQKSRLQGVRSGTSQVDCVFGVIPALFIAPWWHGRQCGSINVAVEREVRQRKSEYKENLTLEGAVYTRLYQGSEYVRRHQENYRDGMKGLSGGAGALRRDHKKTKV